MFSILILTKNEEQDLPGCLDSVKFCDDVHIFDSFSSDHTVDIAKRAGAKVAQRKFDGYASQRNAALSTIRFKYEWVFVLDADERISLPLTEEIYNHLKGIEDPVSGFSIRRRDYFNGTWLKHAQITPYYIRCFRHDRASYQREINEVVQINGTVIVLKEYFCHYPFSKGMIHWLNKHNGYSTLEAKRWIEEHQGNIRFSFKKALFGHSLPERRYHQKGLFYKIPGRPFLKWLYIVFGRRAFLDGRSGITYATLQSIYEYFIVLKTREILSQQKMKPKTV